MSEKLQILIITVSILTGIFSTIFAHQMLSKYNLPYLTTYYYYLIFLYIFGIYGIIGTGIIRSVLTGQNIPPDKTESITLFFGYLGLPFLIISLYMFYRLCREITGKQISAWFHLVYFTIQSLIFLAYGYAIVSVSRFGETRYELIGQIIVVSFSLIAAIIYLVSLIGLFINLRHLLDVKDRNALYTFGYIYLVMITGTLATVNLARTREVFGLGFVFLLFAGHLIPIFFLNIYLDKNYVEPSITLEIGKNIDEFAWKFEISRREKEIIQLICKGKSNQDISESLFISLQTVKDHIHRIYLKTGVKNRVQLSNLIRTFT